MVDSNVPDFSFESELEAEAYCKFFLRVPVLGIEEEFNPEQRKEFLARRELQLKAQLDDLLGLNFKSPQVCGFTRNFYKIAKKIYKNPLSSEGSLAKPSRFNYKNIPQMQNRVVYFGQDKQCCIGELFHLDIQKYNYAKLVERSPEDEASEFKFPEHVIYEYEVTLDNLLVLTTQSTFKALGIPDRVAKNEWFSINDQFEIPTAGQILATIARNRGYKGILYTSVRTQTANNLVIFEEKTGPLDFPLVTKVDLDPTQFF